MDDFYSQFAQTYVSGGAAGSPQMKSMMATTAANPGWYDIHGSGNYDTNAEVMNLIRHTGQNVGQWQFDHYDQNGALVYKVNTPFGVAYSNPIGGMNKGDSGMVLNPDDPFVRAQIQGGMQIGRYHNEHGSDAIEALVRSDGSLQVGMDRESNADRNTILGIIAGGGIAGALAGGVGAGAGAAGAGSSSAGAAGINAGLTTGGGIPMAAGGAGSSLAGGGVASGGLTAGAGMAGAAGAMAGSGPIQVGGAGGLPSMFGGSGGDWGSLLRNLIGGGAAAYDAYQGYKDAGEMRDWLVGQTPNFEYYQDKLKQSYDDPGSYWQGADFNAGFDVLHNKLQRNDAAGGRLAADAGRQSELQKYTLDSLNNYRSGLGDVVNNQTRARLGANESFMENQANRRDAISPITTFLGNLLAGQ